jgi:hypothetical protein
MRKLAIAAAMLAAAFCPGGAFALTAGYTAALQAPASGVVKVSCCHYRAVRRHCWVPKIIGCGCACGCWF